MATSKWHRTNDGYCHTVSGAVISRRASGNPNRNGSWFLTSLPAGWYGCTVPACGVRTLREAKRLVEAEAAKH